jgi:predicted transcriptional regulator
MTLYNCEWCGKSHDTMTDGQVKALYKIICKDKACPNGVIDIRHIEDAIGKSFPNTDEFHRIVGEYVAKKSGTTLTMGEKLKKERKRYRISQSELGRLFGVTKMTVSRYERGSIPLSKSASEWLHFDKGPIRGKVT